jgi:hypothetical protein
LPRAWKADGKRLSQFARAAPWLEDVLLDVQQQTGLGNVMKLTVCVAILAACLAGCVSPEAKRDAEARAQTARALEACKAQTFKTHVERAKCINDGLGLSRTTLANPDLLDLISATRIALAATVDRRELTEEDATVQLARSPSR